ncbi:MAG: L-serine ammonia-lyase, iron-sulfur-dependent, subunit alpha [Thermodesulfobacteriota bacterium]|nr:L-serine ammonia-lyase, iron-sulfur-dependent, subunit alpha [Thermodesulfobacteriota bacterium]
MDYDKIIAILNEKVKPALGCTEPVSVALAVAAAHGEINGELEKIHVKVSPNIYKNGMRVGIPGTKESGILFAVALALVCSDPDLGLELFANVNDDCIETARALLDQGIITIEIEDKKEPFYIKASVTTDHGSALSVIKDGHTNIVLVEKNGVVVQEKKTDTGEKDASMVDKLGSLTIKQLREFIETVACDDIRFLAKGAEMNMIMADFGLREKSGLGLGAGMKVLIDKGLLEDNLINRVRINTAGATDARMAGVKLPVMSSAGSGNHGLTAIIPVVLTCEHFGYGEEKLVRALAFSHLVTIYIKEFTGSLSPVCGCAIAAGVGASAAAAWLLGCDDDQIAGAINNMAGDLAGMICDGAKGGCAFKLSTASGEAILAAQLAKNDIIIADQDGIVGIGAESTIRNIGKLSVQGMDHVDKKIIELMLGAKEN